MAVTRARRDLGVVYTPRDVSEPMVRLVLAPLLDRDVRSLRICDPAIGEGAFLVEIVRVLAEAIGDSRETRAHVASHCIFGVDIDPRAVEQARAAVEDFVGAPVPALREHLRVGDALTIDWGQRFDALVGNPPYVRQERLANKAALERFACYDGVADLYVYFIELAHRIADRYCLIVPNKWMSAAYGRPLRTFLARERSVEGIVDFARALPLFADADAFPAIVWGTGTGSARPIQAARIERPVPVATALAAADIAIDRTRWGSDPWHIDGGDDTELLDRLARHPTLGSIIGTRWSRGVVTGCNRAFVISGAERDDFIADDASAADWIRPFIKGRDIRRYVAPTPSALDRYVLLVDRGTPLARLPRPIRAHLTKHRDALEPRPAGHRGDWTGRKPGPYKWYELQDPVVPLAKSRAPRLFYQDIQTAPACCLDATGELVPDTTVWILPSDDLYLLAVLSSPLYFWYAQRRFPPALNGAVRPKLEYMRAFPIATPSPALRTKITSLVTHQLRAPTTKRDAELAALVNEAYGVAGFVGS